MELFSKIRDIYCVIGSLENLMKILKECGPKTKEQIMTQDFAQKLISSVSSPNLHVPQYNFKTRSLVY